MTIARRELLTGLGVGALVAAAGRFAGANVMLLPLDAPSEQPKPLPPLPDEPGRRLGVALVGIGHLTMEQLLRAFSESRSTQLVALVSGDRAKAQDLAAHTGVDLKRIYDYKSFASINDHPAIEAVYIVLPDHMHAEYTVRAAQAGKHVLSEKPMASTPAEAQQMIDACKRADRKLMIAYHVHYEPHHRFVMQAVRDKRFGAIQLVEGFNGQNSGDPSQWRLKKGAGPMRDVGLYCLNTCRFVLGEKPTCVNATTRLNPSDPRFKDVEESIVFQLGFPSGAIGSFGASFNTHVSRRYRCLGDKGGWIGADPAFWYEGLEVELSEVRGKGEFRARPSIGPKQQFAPELDHFATCVRGDLAPYTPGEEGLADLRIIEAIFSAAGDRKRVELPRVTKLDAYRGTVPS